MRRCDSIRQWNGNVEELVQRETVFGQKLGQGLPMNELHRDEVDSFGFFDGENLHDVGVVECSDGLGFLREPGPALFALG